LIGVVALRAAFVLVLLAAGSLWASARADDPSMPGTKPKPAEERPQPKPGERPGWLDSSHEQVEETLTSVVRRLDGFFGDPSKVHLDPPQSWLRARSELRLGQRGIFEPGFSLLADVRLPSLDKLLSRAHLVVFGGREEVETQVSTDRDGLTPRRISPSIVRSSGAAELRFDVWRGGNSVVDVGGGLRFDIPPPPYFRVRGATAVELGLGFVAYANQALFWAQNAGFGEATRLDLERVFGRRAVARVYGIGTLYEQSRGLEWYGEAGYAQGLGSRTGVYLAGSVEGTTRSLASVDRYRLFTRLRRDVHDAWLYLELEPQYAWPAGPLGNRFRELSVTFRVEVQFAASRL
jgi:hypothetical protein